MALNAPNFGDLERQLSHYDTGASDYTGTAYVYDSWNRLRATYNYVPAATGSGTETPLSPFTVTDYNWQDDDEATATFETVPNWQTVAVTATYAQMTTAGRRSLSKTNYDIHGNAYQQIAYEISATNGTTVNSATVNTYCDLAGRTIAREQQGGPRLETFYNTLNQANQITVLVGNAVVAQTKTTYDIVGNIQEQHQYELNAGESVGITSTSANYTRRSVFNWYDLAGRLTTQADYGSGGPIWSYFPKPSRPATAPNQSSATTLVTRKIYNSNTGNLEILIDVMGNRHKVDYDEIGRITKTIQNFDTGSSSASDEDITIDFSYDGAGNTVAVSAINPSTGNQVNRYFYNDPYNVLLETTVIYPDSVNTEQNGTDMLKRTYSLDGLPRSITDQNGTTHTYTYDSHRRLISDAVSILGAGVDGRVREIRLNYDNLGSTSAVLSRDVNGNLLNAIYFGYDDNGNLNKVTQHNNSESNSAWTRHVSYDRDGISKSYRLRAIHYPSGKSLTYEYGLDDSIDDMLNHRTAIKQGTEILATYTVAGMGSIARTSYPEPGLHLSTDDAALDRFGRVVEYRWSKETSALVHIIHGYDYIGNRTHRTNMLYPEHSKSYQFDLKNQVSSTAYGVLDMTGEAVSPHRTESWMYDKSGNWLQYTNNGITETRTHNEVNEIQGIASYDFNGNTKSMPSLLGTGGAQGIYDAWNRLVKVGENIEYTYNGLSQRIAKRTGTELTHSFYTENWQELESETGGEVTAFVWGPRYIDDLICREKDISRLYALSDPNWNVVAVADPNGDVKERYEYDTFGNLTVLNPDFTEINESSYSWNRTYTGQTYDVETGLILYRMRFYHPRTGRFLTRDPIGYHSHDANAYRYAFNSPLVRTDFQGFESTWHHLLPQAFKNQFNKAGLDIDAADYGWIIDQEYHQQAKPGTPGGDRLHTNRGNDWNADWKEFFDKHKNPSKKDILRQLESMKADCKYAQNLKNGVQATMSYSEWSKGIRQIGDAIVQVKKTKAKQVIKIIGKGGAVVGVLVFGYDAATGGVCYAGEEAAKSLLFPLDIMVLEAEQQVGIVATFDHAIAIKDDRNKNYAEHLSTEKQIDFNTEKLRPGGNIQLSPLVLWLLHPFSAKAREEARERRNEPSSQLRQK